MKHITSRDNPVCKQLWRLAFSARERKKRARTLLDGVHLIEAAREAGLALEMVAVSQTGLAKGEIGQLVSACEQAGITVCSLDDSLFVHVSPVDTPSGIVGIVQTPCAPELVHPPSGSLVVLENIQDPGNLGTIIRTAAAAGIEHVLCCGACAQVWHPRVLRAGMGGHFRLAVHEHVDVQKVLRAYSGTVLATSLEGGSQSLYTVDLTGPIGWLFGGEGEGLSPALQAMACTRVRIPMPGAVESLNVGGAVAVCLFEQLRQLRH